MALLGNLTGSSQYFNDDDFYSGTATQSLKFDEGSTAMLVRTPSSAGNRRTFTISMWVKISDVVGTHILINAFASASPNNQGLVRFSSSALQFTNFSGEYDLVTNRLFRDSSAWYHLVFAVDTTQGTAANRIKIYVNGVQETSFSTGTYPDQNLEMEWNNTVKHLIGARTDNDTPSPIQRYDGYMAEVNLVDGNAYDPTYFGETKNGVWIAKKYSGSYGTNGFRLQFDQVGVGTASTSTIGADTSGNTHHFTSSNIVASDCAMPDSPENNFCTLNQLYFLTASTHLSEGNLQLTHEATAHRANAGTMFSETGKWYFEVRNKTDTAGSNVALGVGLQDITKVLTYSTGDNNYIYYCNNNSPLTSLNTTTNSLGSFVAGAGDIMQVAYDVDSGKLFIGKNNTYVAADSGTDGNPATGANPTATLSTTIDYIPFVGTYNNEATANFGQDDTFAGAISSAGNTDGNGKGVFKYAPPSGFLALCSANLPEPTIGPNSATQADDYFNTVLYTGNASPATHTIGFRPNWVWGKRRDVGAQNHWLINDVTDIDKFMSSDNNDGPSTTAGTTFNATSFTTANNDLYINNNSNYVVWAWKGNGTGTAVSNTDGSITSTVSANTTAGFSIVSATSPSSGTFSVGHGLSKKPDMIIQKYLASSSRWTVWHNTLTSGQYLGLNETNAIASSGTPFNFNITDSVIGGNANYDATSTAVVYYVFHDVEGYSKFGSYSGNGNADGAFVFTGFRPAWVMVKRTDSANNWVINDTTRSTSNEITGGSSTLYADSNGQESNFDTNVDFLSNGFKARTTGGHRNATGTYIYMAFAESPFKFANAR